MDWKNIVKMSILPKAICRGNAIPVKIPVTYFTEINNPKICMKPQKIQNNQSNLEKEEESWRHASQFQITSQSYSNHGMLQSMGLQRVRHNLETEQQQIVSRQYSIGIKRFKDQWKRTYSPEINTNIYGQLTYTKEAKIHNRERQTVLNGQSWGN